MNQLTREQIAKEFAKLEGISLEQAQQELKNVKEDNIIDTIIDIEAAQLAKKMNMHVHALGKSLSKDEIKKKLDEDLESVKPEIINTLRRIRKFVKLTGKEAK